MSLSATPPQPIAAQLVRAYREENLGGAKQLIYEHTERVKQLVRKSIDAVGGEL